MKLARGLLAYLLVVYGPWRFTCNPSTPFGVWCLANSGDWVHRAHGKYFDRLRREQSERAMPLVGQLLDCWDQIPLDARQEITFLAPGLVGNILALDSAMEDE